MGVGHLYRSHTVIPNDSEYIVAPFSHAVGVLIQCVLDTHMHECTGQFVVESRNETCN